MPFPRSTLLLVLLAIMPIALVAWLGTYLLRDAARSTDSAMAAILAERLAVADHQLIGDLRHFTEDLDAMAAEPDAPALVVAQTLAQHPWVVETWVISEDGGVTPVVDKGVMTPTADATAQERGTSIRNALLALPAALSDPSKDHPFRILNGGVTVSREGGRLAVWQTYFKTVANDLPSVSGSATNPHLPSGWHLTAGDFIYWRAMAGKPICCARLNGQLLRDRLFARLPTPGLPMYPGSLTLTTASGIPLHAWGKRPSQPDDLAPAQRNCSPPLSQWVLRYTPAVSEFPKPYLFPILLGVGSGCLLVLTLAWMFFNENERALRVAQQRVSFVNQISHELKTPLTNIQLYTEMAAQRLEAEGDAITKRHLSVVETETARLNRLIQNVLNYARQQRDKLTIQPRPVALDEVVARAVGNWRPLLERKGVAVEVELHGPPAIKADADAIEQILGNLLSNVDKYASDGKHVAIRTETNGASARLIVEDHGRGIPPTKRHVIFEPFGRLRSDLNEGVSGTGIGLTISRELAELHGGTLDVCSQYREGARFILTLPLQSS